MSALTPSSTYGVVVLLLGLLLSPAAMAQPHRPTLPVSPRPAASRPPEPSRPAAGLRPLQPTLNVVRAERSQATRQLAGHLGEAAALELARHLNPAVARQLGAGLDRVQYSPAGRELKALLRQAVSVLSQSRQQAKTHPTQRAVAQQLHHLGLVSAKMIDEGLQVRREPIRGSERGAVEMHVVEGARSKFGFALFQGNNMASVHIVDGERAASIRLTPNRVTRSLDAAGTREIAEETTPTGTFYYETAYALRQGRDKPTRVTTYKSKVDPQGKVIPITRSVTLQESGAAPKTQTEIITRVKVEDRAVP